MTTAEEYDQWKRELREAKREKNHARVMELTWRGFEIMARMVRDIQETRP